MHGTLHNIRLTLRLLSRNKVYTTINLSGLVLGLMISFILLIFAINEASYNRCFRNSDRLFRVICKDERGNLDAMSPFALRERLVRSVTRIEKTSRIMSLGHFIGACRVRGSGPFQAMSGFFCADPDIVDILEIGIIRGKQGGILISEKTARELFPDLDPIGKTIQLSAEGNILQGQVSGVFRDVPWNSLYRTEIIAGFSLYRDILRIVGLDPEQELTSLDDYSVQTLVRLKENSGMAGLQRGLARFSQQVKQRPGWIRLQPLRDMYLDSGNISDYMVMRGSRQNLFIYLSLSLFILLLASMNYTLLSSARSALRFKEIGVRKVLGATRANLRGQLLTESVMLSMIAFPLAYLLIGLIDPVVNRWFGYSLHLNAQNLWAYLLLSAVISLVIGLLSGLSVAMYLARLNPVTALRSDYTIRKNLSFNKIFIILQVFITLALFTGLINVWLQIRLCIATDQGIVKDNLLISYFYSEDTNLYKQLRGEVAKMDNVLSSTGSSIRIPDLGGHLVMMRMPGPGKKVEFEQYFVDEQFFTTLGTPFLKGRDFMAGEPDRDKHLIINEEAYLLFGSKPIDGMKINNRSVIGVIRDFNPHTLHSRMRPMMFECSPELCKVVILRCKAGKEEEVIASLDRAWTGISTDIPIDMHLYDSDLRELYTGEQNFGRVVATFTLLAFVITGMGLFGLAILIAERRLKEMSIRKVFGASWFSIIYLIQKEFMIFVLAAAAFAIPVAWYFLSAWLDQFYYRISLQWYTFVMSMLVVGFFVSSILFLKTLRILQENPATVLKYE